MAFFDWLLHQASPASINIAVDKFTSDSTQTFTEELGLASRVYANAITDLLAFIVDIQNNPYEPDKVVRRCFNITNDNYFLRHMFSKGGLSWFGK